MVVNSVEATLTSRYVDGVSNAVEKSRQILNSNFAAMSNAQTLFGGAADQAFNRAVGALGRWRSELTKAQTETDSKFKAMSLGAVAFGVALGEMAISAVRSIGGYLATRAKEASEVTELKIAYEGLAAATGFEADTLKKLKAATEGLVGSKVLLTNVNRLMQSGVKVSSDEYVKLTENVFRLSKAAGVDGPQAIQALTDSLIKGNARGFQQIGLSMIQVKDGIREFADESTSKMNNAAKAAAFYKELIDATDAAVKKLPADFTSVADGIERIEKQWTGLFGVVGEGILRSKVLQEVLQRVIERLSAIGARKEDVEAIARATNQTVIVVLQLIAALINGTGVLLAFLENVGAAILLVFNGVPAVVGSIITVVSQLIGWLLQAFGQLPGAVGRFFSEIAQRVNLFARETRQATEQLATKATNSFNGTFAIFGKANEAASGIRALAGELGKFAAEVIRGTAARVNDAAATDSQAVSQKALNEQMSKYLALRSEIEKKGTDGIQKAAAEFADTLRKIRDLDLSAVGDVEAKKAELRTLAGKRYLQELAKINQEAVDKQRELDQQGVEISRKLHDEYLKSTAETSAKLFEVISGDAARKEEQRWAEFRAQVEAKRNEDFDKLIAQSREYLALIKSTEESVRAGILSRAEALQLEAEAYKAAKDRLTELNNQSATRNLDPGRLKEMQDLQRDVGTIQEEMKSRAISAFEAVDQKLHGLLSTSIQAWTDFWKDLASGQEGAGKKLLAVFVGFVGKFLVQYGVMLMKMGIGEMVMASTWIGRWLGASMANGIKLLAFGALIAAAGGALQGAASSLAQTNQATSQGNTFQDVPRPNTSNPVQIIRVGRPGEEDNPKATSKDLGTLKIEVPQGFVVKHVADNVKSNGVLRTVIQNA